MPRKKKIDTRNGVIIESGIPMPKKHGGLQLPLNSMKVGDSFFIESSKPSSLYGQLRAYRLAHDKTDFTVRKMDNGFRVWRIK